MDTIEKLQDILAPRNRAPQDPGVLDISREMINLVGKITCKDGFHVSVQASKYHYCSPRDSVGPWKLVELGFPSEKVLAWQRYAEDKRDPTRTVYSYVPLYVVARALDRHGGIVSVGEKTP
jgi:hypothetical protein